MNQGNPVIIRNGLTLAALLQSESIHARTASANAASTTTTSPDGNKVVDHFEEEFARLLVHEGLCVDLPVSNPFLEALRSRDVLQHLADVTLAPKVLLQSPVYVEGDSTGIALFLHVVTLRTDGAKGPR